MTSASQRRFDAEVTIPVRYAETDQMGVVYHANYLVWFNEARDRLLQVVGLNVTVAERRGYLMPVVSASCRYHSPARYGDVVVVRAEATMTTVAKFTVSYRVRHAENRRVIATGRTESVLLDGDGRLVLRPPPDLAPRGAGDDGGER